MKKSHRIALIPERTPPAPASGLIETPDAESYTFGQFRLMPRERTLLRGCRAVPLPPKAFDALLLLVRNAGHLMLKEDLMKVLWPETFVEEVNLANKISLLRKVLDDHGATPRFIQTAPKLGYRFVSAVTRVWKQGPGDGRFDPVP